MQPMRVSAPTPKRETSRWGFATPVPRENESGWGFVTPAFEVAVLGVVDPLGGNAGLALDLYPIWGVPTPASRVQSNQGPEKPGHTNTRVTRTFQNKGPGKLGLTKL